MQIPVQISEDTSHHFFYEHPDCLRYSRVHTTQCRKGVRDRECPKRQDLLAKGSEGNLLRNIPELNDTRAILPILPFAQDS